MLKVLTAFTEEIDAVDRAVQEIVEQLDLDKNRLTNSLGIIHCFSDFVDSGVVRALAQKLPFDTVGCTTMSSSTSSGMSLMGLTVTVLTSDDVRFACGVTAPITDSVEGPLTELFRRITGELSGQPAMLMPFVPFLLNVGGDEFVEQLDALSGGIPAFGTIAISTEPDFSRTYTFYNGEPYPASMVLAALGQGAKPEFFNVSVNEENILKQKAIVTGTNRNVLQTINNIPAVTYLESIGLAKDGDVGGIASMPIILYLEDGSILIRACFGTTKEGALILGGTAPVNSSVALGTMGYEDVISSTERKVREALKTAEGRGLLMYSCGGRNLALGVQSLGEHETVKECVSDRVPYHFVYSGGEIFPSVLSGGTIVNHMQNNSLIICVL
ncbi:MAG: FIST C-terminal domain-containing protein [Treponema sp.]|jgi:hypothetical protein|nr:FIST C-terminal domain-containing protein [Treponema sp.]